jgi:hypothetical protein
MTVTYVSSGVVSSRVVLPSYRDRLEVLSGGIAIATDLRSILP